MKFKEKYIFRTLEIACGLGFIAASIHHLILINQNIMTDNLLSLLPWIFQVGLMSVVLKQGYSILFKDKEDHSPAKV